MKVNSSIQSPLVRLRWLTYASFEIQANGVSIVIDPYIGASKYTDLTAECIENADYVLISHTHYDHVTDIKYLMDKFGAKVLCGQLAANCLTRWLDCNPVFVYPVAHGLELNFGAVKVKALFGRHTDLNKIYSVSAESAIKGALEKAGMSGEDSDEMQRLGPLEYTNYLITLPNGLRIVFYGGPDLPEARVMLSEARPDILLTQFTMKSQNFVDFMDAVGAKFVVPHHMDSLWPKNEYELRLEQVCAGLAEKHSDTVVITPEHGQWYDFYMGVSAAK